MHRLRERRERAATRCCRTICTELQSMFVQISKQDWSEYNFDVEESGRVTIIIEVVAVITRGWIFISRRIGPTIMPELMPRRPAQIPASRPMNGYKHTIINVHLVSEGCPKRE